MIAALAEGASQSLLPCSWSLIVPAFLVGIGSRRSSPAIAFWGSLIVGAWIMVAGWLVPPLWIAGIVILGGTVLWWRRGLGPLPAALIGFGAAWAWRPCVGQALGTVLNAAQLNPAGSIWGLAAFLTGVSGFGLALGLLARRFASRQRWTDRAGAGALALLGGSMLVGVYPYIASELARWSTILWA